MSGAVGHLRLCGAGVDLCRRQPVAHRLPQLRQVYSAAMNLLLFGVNHVTAPLALREKLAGLIPDVGAAYDHVQTWPEITESLMYATCNRVEFICVTEDAEGAAARVREFFGRHPEIAPGDLEESFFLSLHRTRDLQLTRFSELRYSKE